MPAALAAGKEPAVPGIVARVRPRASKGITDLLLLSVSYGFITVNPSKKSFSISGGLGVYDPRPTPRTRERRRPASNTRHRTHEAAGHGKLTERNNAIPEGNAGGLGAQLTD